MENKAVLTTRFVLEENSLIAYVVHDHDWQFFGKEENADEKDGRVVALKELIDMDATLKNILWLPEGMEAWRESINGEWKAVQIQE